MKLKTKAQPMAEPFIDQRILEFLNRVPKSAKILDIACGQGYLLEVLEANGYWNLYSADLDEANFGLSKKRYHFKKVDANLRLPYPNDFFDIVISSETIEHLENPSFFLREVHRILTKKGGLILSTPGMESIVGRIYYFFTGKLPFHTQNDYEISGHITVLPSWLLERLFERAGFKPVGLSYSSFYLPILKLRLTQPFFLNKFWGWVAIYKLIKA